jgi:hypothetical protein
VKDFNLFAPIIGISTKCIYSWVLELIVSNVTGKNQWGK